MKKVPQLFFLFSLLIYASIFFYLKGSWLGEFPQYNHSWAQADRYAFALGFLENGFDFFHPQTLNLNPQFPAANELSAPTSISAVDFPLHEYLIALLMKLLGNEQPIVFQLYYLCFNFWGLYFLLRLSFLLTHSKSKTFFFGLAVLLSPLYIDYFDGFLTATSSLSFLFFAFWQYCRFYLQQKKQALWWSALGFSLAALCRTPFAIFLIAIIGSHFLPLHHIKWERVKKAIPFLLATLPIVAYYFYNQYLRQTYGSMYLNAFLYADNIDEILEIIQLSWDNWKGHYFTWLHYLSLATLVVFSIIFRRKTKIPYDNSLWIIAIGVIAYALLMVRQWVFHDYYFLETFFPLVLLIALDLLAHIRMRLLYRPFLIVGALIISGFTLLKCKATIDSRNSERFYHSIYSDYEAQKTWLDQLNIPDTATFLLPDGGAPNIPLLGIERKGYVLLRANRNNLQKAFEDYPFDYLLIRNRKLVAMLLNHYAEGRHQLKWVGQNENFSLFKHQNNPLRLSISEFLQLDELAFKKEFHYRFNSNSHIEPQHPILDQEEGYPEAPAALVVPENPFLSVCLDSVIGRYDHQIPTNYYFISGRYLLHEKKGDISLILRREDESGILQEESHSLLLNKDSLGSWQHFRFDFHFPMADSSKEAFTTAFFYNPNGNTYWLDDLHVQAYRK